MRRVQAKIQPRPAGAPDAETDLLEPPLHYVGERVQIRGRGHFQLLADVDGIIEAGDEVFVEPMFAYCGEWARITGLDPFGSFLLDIDKGEFGWSGAMFEDNPDYRKIPRFAKKKREA